MMSKKECVRSLPSLHRLPSLLFLSCLLLLLILVPGTDATGTSGADTPPSGADSSSSSQLWGSGAAALLASLRSISLALQSMFQRVATQRISRGDHTGAERAQHIATTLGNGLQWWTGLGSLSWDYVTNYFFTQSISRGTGVSQAMGLLGDFSAIVGEVTQLRSDSERIQWITKNYSRALGVAKSLFRNLLAVFDQNGAMRNIVLAMQREVLEGDLLRDVLRLGPTDLESLVRMSKDVLQRVFAPAPPAQRDTEL